MADFHINNSEEVIEYANMLSSEGRIDELNALLEKINDEINRFPLDERSEDNQLSLLRSKHEVESLIERNVISEPILTQSEAEKEQSTEDINLQELVADKDKFLIACVIISVISAIGFFKFGLNFLFAFIPLFFFKKWKSK